MNIPPSRSGDLVSAAQTQRVPQRAASQAPDRPAPPERVQQRAGRGQQPGGDLDPASPSQRLENVSQTVGSRLDWMIENGDLTEDQKAALVEAKGEFQGYLERLGGALEQGGFRDEDKAGLNLARFMGHLREEVTSALNPTPVLPPESDSGPAPLRPTAARRVGGDEVREQGGDDTQGVSPEALSSRLDLAQDRLEDRLRNLRSQGMDEESAARLAEAYDQFTATFERMQYGIENGTLSMQQLGEGFRYALDQLREGVRPEQPPAQVRGNGRAVDGGQPVGATPAERLEAVADRIEGRLEGLVAGLDPEAARALEAAGQGFESLVDRLQNALGQGFDQDRAGDLLGRLVNQLRLNVQETLGSERQRPALYDRSMALASLYDVGSTGVDASA